MKLFQGVTKGYESFVVIAEDSFQANEMIESELEKQNRKDLFTTWCIAEDFDKPQIFGISD